MGKFKRTRLSAWAISDPGSRDHNEDAFLIFQSARQSVVAVCDGMGGHAAGEVASGLAVKTIQEYFTELEKGSDFEGLQPDLSVKASIDTANEVIFNDAKVNPSREGMGSTCVVGLIRGTKLYLGHVGDSRAYLVRGGGVRRLTRDHSFVEEMVKAGMITPHETHSNPQRNVILQSLGRNDNVNVELCAAAVKLKIGDYVLLCSDGLTAVVDDQEIAESVEANVEPQPICEHLVELTNNRGAPDNVTVALMRFDGLVNEGPRVAVVSDDDESSELYRLILSREGYQSSSRQAEEMATLSETERPRLVIVDYSQEPEQALAITSDLKQQDFSVMLINHGDFTQQDGREAGADHVEDAESLLTEMTSVVRRLVEKDSNLVYILEEKDGESSRVARALRKAGFIVMAYNNQRLLQSAVEQSAPQMLILHTVRGVERLCQLFKDHPATIEVPIVLSKEGAVANPREAFQIGAEYYLPRIENIVQLAHMLLNR